jgi:hypothetical protein
MQIVNADQKYQEQGFTAAIKLEEDDIGNFKKILKNGSREEITEAILKIINFAIREGHRMPFTQDEFGDDSLLLEIKGEQWITDTEIPDVRNSLSCILLNHVPV